jgi:hypothetical protein
MTIWYILYSFGTFFRFWYHAPRKILQPCCGTSFLILILKWSCRTDSRLILSHRPSYKIPCAHGPASCAQGCQMVCFQTKNQNLGKLWRVLQWKILVYFITIWSILLLLEIFYGHLVYFVVIWYIFLRFGILHLEKSGNPACATPKTCAANENVGCCRPSGSLSINQARFIFH